MRLTSFVVSCVISYLAAPGAVTKAPSAIAPGAAEKAAAKKPAGFVLGRSVGSPTDGHLIGGSHLDDAPYLRTVPIYAQGDVRWGLGPLVSLIDRAARQVHRQYPDAILSTGHLSRHGGGELDRHASHESGRDADIGFYVRSQTNKPLYADHFVQFKGDGTAASWPGAVFDDAKNWALVSALVTDPVARVTHIFVATPLRARLLAYAERSGAPIAVRVRASEVMAQPRGALPHDDHFHVRIGCPSGMTGCIEDPTAPKQRFARVPVPQGRSHGVAAHHAKATPTPGPNLTPGPTPTPSPSPTPDPSPAAGAAASSEGPVDRLDDAPAMLIDDVDGIIERDVRDRH